MRHCWGIRSKGGTKHLTGLRPKAERKMKEPQKSKVEKVPCRSRNVRFYVSGQEGKLTCWCSEIDPGNTPEGDSLQGNHKGLFIGVLPSCPEQQAKSGKCFSDACQAARFPARPLGPGIRAIRLRVLGVAEHVPQKPNKNTKETNTQNTHTHLNICYTIIRTTSGPTPEQYFLSLGHIS